MPTATVNGTNLNYTDSGEGTAVLLLHAFPFNSQMWEPQIESLSDRWRLIAPDLKGFGTSDAPEDRGTYTMDDYADQAKGLLDHLGIQDAVVVGLSMGGYIAFSFLRRHSDTLAALVLADTRAEADAPEGVEKRTAQQQTVAEKGIAPLVNGMPDALLGEPTRAKKPEVVERVKELMQNPAAGYIGALEAMKNRPDSTPDLGKVNVPTLVIVGENDGLTPPDFSRKLHEHIRGSRLVVIPEAGHMSNLEAPEAFNGALAEFLSEL
jgi:3-oxoadipate enol-lactonase